MHPLVYLSYGGIASLSRLILNSRDATYFTLVLILLALVMCLCWCMWLGKTRRENDLAQHQQVILAHVEERMLLSSRLETQALKYERQVDKYREMIKEVCSKNKEVEQIRDAKRELDYHYEELNCSLSECEAKNHTLNEGIKKQRRELEIKSKELEETHNKLKETQSMLKMEQNVMERTREDLKQLQEEFTRELDEKRRLEEVVQNESEKLNSCKYELDQHKMAVKQCNDQLEQERLWHSTEVQEMKLKLEKEKDQVRASNEQLSECRQKNRKLKDKFSEFKDKHSHCTCTNLETLARLSRKGGT